MARNFEKLPSLAPLDEVGGTAMNWWQHLQGVRHSEQERDQWVAEGELREVDLTASVSEALGLTHPYLLSDVEIYAREQVCDLREEMHSASKEMWHEEAYGEGDRTHLSLPQPPGRSGADLGVGVPVSLEPRTSVSDKLK